MGLYPIEVAAQELYTTSTTRKHPLGTVGVFKDSSGNPIFAKYMYNDAGATLAAGLAVAHAGIPGHIGGAVATNTPPALYAGGLAASLPSTSGYGWVIFRGVQTNVSASASTASSAGDRVLAPLAGDLAVVAATYASTTAGYANISVCALLKAGDALATGAANTVYWLWR